MTPTTTFASTTGLVWNTCRTPDLLRSASRNERIGNCVIANRSNYTRVTFDNASSAAFLVPVGPYSVRLNARPMACVGVHVLGVMGERVGMMCNANELRAMAYGLLAAANWVDGRDTRSRQAERKPAIQA
jgi:hypothetical protein